MEAAAPGRIAEARDLPDRPPPAEVPAGSALPTQFQQDAALANALNILFQETVQTCQAKQIPLDAVLLEKLQLLSILTHLHAATTYSLPLLARQLAASHDDTLRLLIKASIAKLLSASID